MVSDEIICLFFHFLKMDSLQANLAIVSHAVRIFFTILVLNIISTALQP